MLFHVSENPEISSFRPRQISNRMDMPPVVWAVDGEHQYGFYCPRIVISHEVSMDPSLEADFFGHTAAQMIIVMEQAWYEQLRKTTIYRYVFEPYGFQLFDEIAGYYVSEQVTVPIQTDAITDPLLGLCRPELRIEVRLVPSLYPLRDQILSSGLKDFSIHRLKYATPNRI